MKKKKWEGDKMLEIVEFVKKTKFERAIYEFRDVNNERVGGYEYKVSHKLSREEIIERIIKMLKAMEREGWQLYYKEKSRYEPWPTIYGDKEGVDVPHFKLALK